MKRTPIDSRQSVPPAATRCRNHPSSIRPGVGGGMVKTCQLWMVIPCLPHMEFVSMFSHTWLKLPPPVLPRRSTDWPAYLTRFERTSTRGLRWPLPPLTRSSCEGSATVAGASEDIRVEKSAQFSMGSWPVIAPPGQARLGRRFDISLEKSRPRPRSSYLGTLHDIFDIFDIFATFDRRVTSSTSLPPSTAA